MTDEEYYPLKDALNILARKRYPDVSDWAAYAESECGWKCHICDCSLNEMDYKVVRQHGANHLKERNLLPFA